MTPWTPSDPTRPAFTHASVRQALQFALDLRDIPLCDDEVNALAESVCQVRDDLVEEHGGQHLPEIETVVCDQVKRYLDYLDEHI